MGSEPGDRSAARHVGGEEGRRGATPRVAPLAHSGPRAGTVIEDLHTITAWTPATWGGAAVAESQFRQFAAYDGDEHGRPRVAIGTPGA